MRAELSGMTDVVAAAGSAVGARGARMVPAGRDAAALAPLASSTGGQVVTADATNFADVDRCVAEAVSTTGRIDGIVNCAGSIGIRVNAVAPGLVETPMSQHITANELARKASIAMHPLGRLGTADDIAEAVCWLLTPHSAWVTGQIIGVDGGLATLKSRSKTDGRSRTSRPAGRVVKRSGSWSRGIRRRHHET